MMSSNLKPVRIKKQYIRHKDEFADDCSRIQQVLMEHGYYATIDQCEELWEMYSDEYAAGWLIFPEDNADIYEYIKDYIEE
jgi:hypothetical protein